MTEWHNPLFSDEKLRDMRAMLTPTAKFLFSQGYDYCHLRVPRKPYFAEVSPGLLAVSKILLFNDGEPEVSFKVSTEIHGDENTSLEEDLRLMTSFRGLYLSTDFADMQSVDEAMRSTLRDNPDLLNDPGNAVKRRYDESANLGRPLAQLVLWAKPRDVFWPEPTTATFSYDLLFGPLRTLMVLDEVTRSFTDEIVCPPLPGDVAACVLDPCISFEKFPAHQTETDVIPFPFSLEFCKP